LFFWKNYSHQDFANIGILAGEQDSTSYCRGGTPWPPARKRSTKSHQITKLLRVASCHFVDRLSCTFKSVRSEITFCATRRTPITHHASDPRKMGRPRRDTLQ
jgi:hypothetical protein